VLPSLVTLPGAMLVGISAPHKKRTAVRALQEGYNIRRATVPYLRAARRSSPAVKSSRVIATAAPDIAPV
jgi:hypothetical protein